MSKSDGTRNGTGNNRNTMPSPRRILQNNLFSMRFLWNYSKGYLFFSLADTLICGFHSPLVLLLTRFLFDRLEEACPFSEALGIVLSITAILLGYHLWDKLSGNVISPLFTQKIHGKVQTDLFEKVRKMELSMYDDPKFYNDFMLAMENADATALAAVTNLKGMLSALFTVSATLGLLAYVDPLVTVFLFFSAVAATILDTQMKKNNFHLRKDLTAINRKKEYINRLHKQADWAQELRLTDFGEKLKKDYEENTGEYVALTKSYGKKTVLNRCLDKINHRAFFIAVVSWTIYRVAIGKITLGGFSIVVNSCNRFKNSLLSFVKIYTGLSEQSLYIDKVRAFAEYVPKERKGLISAPPFEKLELKNVSFGYSEDADVLHNVSLTLERGEKIAIVGYNGAGKSTLIKLIMHLYEPSEGMILYNGRDYRDYETDSYRCRIGAVFQDYKLFAATIGENVLGDQCTDDDRKRIENALHLADFDKKLQNLPNGINTMITREFDETGTNLSGGESQKIAIARVFARPFDLVIMDEPSSSLDPEAEHTLNRNIAGYAAEKTVVFISHRLSTTMHADHIYMLEDGRVVENGSHSQLMTLGGKYAEMFNLQAEKYRKSLINE